MASMTSLAEDLLKTRTIPELRDRVNQLEKESNAKKTELQLMVGSKYHDFIQSADMINEMRGQVTTVEQQIERLWKCNQDLVQRGHNLLNLTQPQTNRKRKTVEVSTLLADLTPASVWTSLNDCNVFLSSQYIISAAMLSSKSLRNSDLASCFKFFSVDSQKLISTLRFSKQNRSDFLSVVNIAKTVSDDSELILLDGESYSQGASVERAKALAALGVTAQSSTNSLLNTYLSVADIRVQEVFEGDLCVKHKGHAYAPPPSVEVLLRGLTSLVTILQEVTMDLYQLFFVPVPTLVAAASQKPEVEEVLGLVEHYQRELVHSAVVALQSYCDSIRNHTIDNSKPTANVELSFDMTTYLAFLQNSASSTSAAASAVSIRDRVNEWLSATLRKVTERCKGVLASITNASDVAMLQQRVWRTCTTIATVGAVSVGDSANAKQQRERSDSLKANVVASSTDVAASAQFHASNFYYSQSVWDTACQELLLPANGLVHPSHHSRRGGKHRPKALTPKASDGKLHGQSSNILYSTVFRVSFMHQVERLLSSSCADILSAVKRTVFHALQLEGITLDPSTFAVKSINPVGASGPDSVSSVRIFNIAEYIRREFEHLMTVLYLNSNGSHLLSSSAAIDDSHSSDGSAVTSGTSDDPHAAATLTKVLHGHCSQLIGQLLIILRSIGESCRDALLSRGVLMSTSEWNSLFVSIKDAKSGKQPLISKDLQALLKNFCTNPNMTLAHSNSAQLQSGSSFVQSKTVSTSGTSATSTGSDSTPLLSAMLLVGRVAWLFKIRGQFLETSLRPLPSKGGISGSRSGIPDSGVTQNSEDQFRSAFEIADTNGDGVINYNESIEAISALSNSEVNPTASNLASNFPGISPSLTPSMTYGEFSLIAGGQLIVSSDQNPLKSLRSCLDHLVALTHSVFACCVAVEESKSLGEQLVSDLALNSLKKGNLKDIERLFKISWVTKCMAGDMDDSMQVPSCCSTSLSSLWSVVNSRVSAACVSIDTLQKEIESPFSTFSSLGSASFDASATVDALDDDDNGAGANVLAVLCGLNQEGITSKTGFSNATSPMLSQVVSRITFQLTLALIYRTYNTQLQQLKSTISTLTSEGGVTKTAGLDSLLEDVSLQVVFDLAVMERSCPPYCCVAGAVTTNTTFFAVLTNQWRTYLDSVTAELVLPLLEESVREYAGRVHLLYPPVSTSAVAASSAKSSATAAGSVGVQSSSEQILSRIFPTLASGVTPAARFALLPLALMTAPSATVTPTSATAAFGSGTPSKPGSAPVRSGNIFSSNGSTHSSGGGTPVNAVTSSNNLAGLMGPNSGKSTSSSIKWW